MPTPANALFLRAARLHAEHRLEQAVALYRAALELDAELAECALYLGMALLELDRPSQALEPLELAVHLLPDDAEPLNALGAARFATGDMPGARAAHERALAAVPDSADALDGLGNVFQGRGEPDRAIDCYRRALAIRESAETLSNLGTALKAEERTREALASFERALELAPDDPATLTNLGNTWQQHGDMDRARACFDQALRAHPGHLPALWARTFAALPMLFDRQEDISPARAAYAEALDVLEQTLREPDRSAAAAEYVGANQPFYLTYQGRNDRSLQLRYGRLVHRIMAARFPEYTAPLPRRTGSRLRVGILSGHMFEHSVWKIPTRGWAAGLDRSRFEVLGYHVGLQTDHCTEEARQLFDRFIHQPHDFAALLATIKDHELDALLFPEIGMDPNVLRFACLRLAPVQAVSLGHPMTTGLPTVDHFLSSALMEPEQGERWYTEELVRLPNLGVHYEPLPQRRERFTRADFGLPEDAFLFLCPQSLFKYLPQHDELFARIAARVPGCRFVFVEFRRAERLTERFSSRLARAFSACGLRADEFVTLLPHQPGPRFHGLNTVCDLFLDSLGWSGFNTAMEAAGAGLPAIACPQPQPGEPTPMRARHTTAVLRMMDLEEAVAPDMDSYVELAAGLAADEDRLRALRDRMLANRTQLYRDAQCIRGLEEYLERVCHAGDSNG